ncbi:MAG: cytochrome P450 [Alphaproteobacteria bacterium]|nr:cytochrome P450 [Alphaproteobacteria bacterium]
MQASGPTGVEKLRYVLRLRGAGTLDALFALWQAYGDTARIALPFLPPLYAVNDPADVMVVLRKQADRFVKGRALRLFNELIGDGVVTAEGERWRDHRRAVQPYFAKESLASYGPAVCRVVAEHRSRWLRLAEGFDDFNPLLRDLAQDVIARALLGAQPCRELSEVQQAWARGMAVVVRRSNAVLRLPRWLTWRSHRRYRRARHELRSAVDRLIRRHLAPGRGPEPGTVLAHSLAEYRDGRLGEYEIRNRVLNLLFAGHETLAGGLASALFLILAHPPVRDRVLAELRNVLRDEPPEYGLLRRQPYFRQTILETFRLYPPVPIFVREATGPVELSAGTLPRGAIVLLSPYIMHRHPELWKDPEQFDPDRFAMPGLLAPPRFFAFGAGGRTCLGNEFAVNHIMLILGDLLQRLHIELDQSAAAGLAFDGILRPAPIKLRVRAAAESAMAMQL